MLVSRAKTTLEIILKLDNLFFSLNIFVSQCYFRDLYNHWKQYLRNKYFDSQHLDFPIFS